MDDVNGMANVKGMANPKGMDDDVKGMANPKGMDGDVKGMANPKGTADDSANYGMGDGGAATEPCRDGWVYHDGVFAHTIISEVWGGEGGSWAPQAGG